MRVAVIENGVVVNVMIVDVLEPNMVESNTANIGDLYVDGVFITPPPPAKTPEELWAELQSGSRLALEASDKVATRCFKDGIAYPAEWRTYDAILRSIAGATTIGDYTQSLPVMPTYPTYTAGQPNLLNIMQIDSAI